MANALAFNSRALCLDDIEPDLNSGPGRAKTVRSLHQCLSYLLREVEQVGDVKLSEAMEDAVHAAERLMRLLPDYKN